MSGIMNMIVGSSFGAPVPVYYLYSWGINSSGELGLGNTINRSSPNQIGASSTWSVIDGSWLDGCQAIKNDGTMWSWGYNGSYQLGLGDNTSRSSPVQIGSDTNWANVAAGNDFRLAIKTTGSLWAWGENYHGAQGTGFTFDNATPVQIGTLTNWASIAAGSQFSASIKTDGTLWTWGNNGSDGRLGLGNTNQYSSPKQVGSLTNWSKISCGVDWTISIKTDGTLWSWGNNGSGNLGQGNTTSRSSPVQVGSLTNWSSVSAGGYFCSAIKTDGTLWTWGYNGYGVLGLNNASDYSSPKQVGALTTWSKSDSAHTGYGYHIGAIKTDGTLWMWGRNTLGQLGFGNTTNYSSPKQLGSSTNWLSVQAAGRHTVALG